MTESPDQPAMERHPMYGNLRVAPAPGPAGDALPGSAAYAPPEMGDFAGVSGVYGGGPQQYHGTPRAGDGDPNVSKASLQRMKKQSSPLSDDSQQASRAGPARTARRANGNGKSSPPHKGPVAPGSSGGAGLEHIPRAFVLQRLHELAPTFLSNPRTSDVRIVVPARQRPVTPDSRRTSETGPKTPESMASPMDSQPTPPPAAAVPARSYRLHRDYLVPQSSLFRIVLTGGLRPGAPELKGCRLLPFTSLHGPRPVYVPLPDPASFDVLIQWMYYGSVEAIETALTTGQVSWRGLIANIQYLGMDDRTKRVVGGWWRRWVRTEERERGCVPRKVIVHEQGSDSGESDGEDYDEDDDEDDEEDFEEDISTNGSSANGSTNGGSVHSHLAVSADGYGHRRDGAAPALDAATEEVSARLGGL